MDASFVIIPLVMGCQVTGAVRLSAHSRTNAPALVGQQREVEPLDVLDWSATPFTVSVPRLVVTM